MPLTLSPYLPSSERGANVGHAYTEESADTGSYNNALSASLYNI